MKRINKTVVLEIPETVVSPIETMLGNFKNLSPVQRMSLGRMISAQAVEQLRTTKTELEKQASEIASLIGESVTRSAVNTSKTVSGSKGKLEKIAKALKGGKALTKEEITAATGEKWINVEMKNPLFKSDNGRPAKFSLV